MAIHRFVPSVFHNVLGGRAPVLSIASGDIVETETVDAHGQDSQELVRAEGPNPLTGPFEVRGAVPGDCLSIRLLSIEPNRERCWTRPLLAPNVLDQGAESFPELARSPSVTDVELWTIDPAAGTVSPIGLPDGAVPIEVALAPMLGCLGCAPPGGQAISTATSGEYGGNMDWNGARAGMTLLFPVFMPGAMFALGDGHATQSDGEICGTGTEVSMRVRFAVELIKGKSIAWPHAEDNDHLYTIGNARPLEDALRHATTEMAEWLSSDWGLSARHIGLLLGQTARYEVANIFDPAYTIVCRLSKRHLDGAHRA
ncbi:MAG TPA: acetamidase/formamidase family protein [Spirochaetia bacterium]|nr:acetamidase/formamidase family protein [Spirochaetia bacterium]